jgi:hypothetical protein
MADLSRPDRLQIMLNAEELKALDDWRFAHRLPSRAAAVRELLRRGLSVGGIMLDTEGRQSTSFGVVDEEAAAADRVERSRRSAGDDAR